MRTAAAAMTTARARITSVNGEVRKMERRKVSKSEGEDHVCECRGKEDGKKEGEKERE